MKGRLFMRVWPQTLSRKFNTAPCLCSLSKRTFFGKNRSSSPKSSSKGSQLHTYLLKEGNKHLSESALLAINDYDQAIDTEESAEAYAKRALAYFYIKDYDQAMADVETAMKLNSRSVEALCAAASVKVALNKHQEALEFLSDALELTSPLDFRRKAIEEVVTGSKLALRLELTTPNTASATVTGTATPVSAQVLTDSSTLESQVTVQQQQAQAANMAEMPFDNADFMNLQKDLTQQMVTIGGEEFQAKLMKLNEIPAVQRFQRKALNGQKPDYDDYMELMKDAKFRQYNQVMTEIAKNPKFESVTAKFAQMDWMGAYQELQKDPQALALYMKAFESLDDD